MAIITVSRGSMSGGEALAQCLAENLRYPLLGREVAVEAATKLGVSADTLAQKIERTPTLWGRLTSDRRIYVTAVQAALAEHAVEGDLIYHGLAGHLLLKEVPNVIRVRLVAPLEARIRAVMEKRGLTADEAASYIRKVDEDRSQWTKFIYEVDWRDSSLYDLVINLEHLTLDTACHIVSDLARQPAYALTDRKGKALADFLLACRVKVALAMNPQTRGLDLETRCENGVAEISGQIPSADMLTRSSRRAEEEILHTAEAVEGVTKALLNVEKFNAYH